MKRRVGFARCVAGLALVAGGLRAQALPGSWDLHVDEARLEHAPRVRAWALTRLPQLIADRPEGGAAAPAATQRAGVWRLRVQADGRSELAPDGADPDAVPGNAWLVARYTRRADLQPAADSVASTIAAARVALSVTAGGGLRAELRFETATPADAVRAGEALQSLVRLLAKTGGAPAMVAAESSLTTRLDGTALYAEFEVPAEALPPAAVELEDDK